MRRHSLLVSLAFALTTLPRPGTSQALVIANVSIIDPSAQEPVSHRSVVADGDRVVAVGRAPRLPEGARVIDGWGKFLVPGLWDMHAHLAALTAIECAPEHYVSFGVLGVRAMGGLPDSLFRLRRAIERVLAGTVRPGEGVDVTRPPSVPQSPRPWEVV